MRDFHTIKLMLRVFDNSSFLLMVRRRRISDLSSIYNANRSVLYLNDKCLLYWYTNFDNACVFGRRYSLDQVCNPFVVLEMLEFKRSMFSSYFIGALYLMNKIYDLITFERSATEHYSNLTDNDLEVIKFSKVWYSISR